MRTLSTSEPQPAGRAVATAVLLLTLAATPIWAQPETVVLSIDLPDRPTAGAELFEKLSCGQCHALGGGAPDIGPDLSGLLFTGTALDLAGALWNHAPTMRDRMQDLDLEPTAMSSDEMTDLVAYLGVLRYYLVEREDPGDPAVGERAYREKRCGVCHEAADPVTGLAIGPSLERYGSTASQILLAQAMWNHGGEMADAMRADRMRPPAFAGLDMANVAAYLRSRSTLSRFDDIDLAPGDPRLGRSVFTAKRCDACHAVAGRGSDAAIDLGLRNHTSTAPIAEIAGVMWNHSQWLASDFVERAIPRVRMSGQEMADLIAYVSFADWANVRATPARGAEVWAGSCAVCHTLGGGSRVGPDLATAPGIGDPLALMASMWNHAAAMDQEMRRMGMPRLALQPGQTADLLAFLMTRRAPLADD